MIYRDSHVNKNSSKRMKTKLGGSCFRVLPIKKTQIRSNLTHLPFSACIQFHGSMQCLSQGRERVEHQPLEDIICRQPNCPEGLTVHEAATRGCAAVTLSLISFPPACSSAALPTPGTAQSSLSGRKATCHTA